MGQGAETGSGARAAPAPRVWGVTRSILVLEHAQDVVTVVVGLVLVILAAILLVSGIARLRPLAVGDQDPVGGVRHQRAPPSCSTRYCWC